MGNQRENFSISGPSHLKDIDWKNAGHKRAIAASLVRGAYVHERDRQKNRQAHEALANSWWEFFNFELFRVLVDGKDGSYYGAIYKYKSQDQDSSPSGKDQGDPPRYVVAFRGTLTKLKTIIRDFQLDLLIIFNEIHHSTRYKLAVEAVNCTVNNAATGGATSNLIWLAGHSLGASLALAVGKEMAKNDFYLETFLFNSPFSAIPVEIITKNRELKNALRLLKNGVTAALSIAIHYFRGATSSTDNHFEKLSRWIPHIFVNDADFICAEYVGFFANRESLFKIGQTSIANHSTRHSIISLISLICGRDPEPSYLLPSAYVTINPSTGYPNISKAHQLEQWWNPNLNCEPILYRYTPEEASSSVNGGH